MNFTTKSLLIFLIISAGLLTQAQNKSGSDVLETAVAKLQQKVLLSDQQASQVKSILSGNLKNMQNASTKAKAVNEAKTKVEGLLDARQKAKYSIIKDDWWSNLTREIDESAK